MHARNYRLVRQAILDMPRFNWMNVFQGKPTDSGCIACACLTPEEEAPADVDAQARAFVMRCKADLARELAEAR